MNVVQETKTIIFAREFINHTMHTQHTCLYFGTLTDRWEQADKEPHWYPQRRLHP